MPTSPRDGSEGRLAPGEGSGKRPEPDGDSRGGSDPVPLYILAGGRSTRFGQDKALAETNGVPLIVRIARALGPGVAPVTVVAAHSGAYDHLGLRTIGDVVADKGPVGGLLTALGDVGRPGWLLVSACDWLGLQSEWIDLLLRSRGETTQAAVFKTPDRCEPLFGLYHTSIEPLVSSQIDTGDYPMWALLERVDVAEVPAPEGWSRVTNVNRPADLT